MDLKSLMNLLKDLRIIFKDVIYKLIKRNLKDLQNHLNGKNYYLA